jgi:hypothetical protein
MGSRSFGFTAAILMNRLDQLLLHVEHMYLLRFDTPPCSGGGLLTTPSLTPIRDRLAGARTQHSANYTLQAMVFHQISDNQLDD